MGLEIYSKPSLLEWLMLDSFTIFLPYTDILNEIEITNEFFYGSYMDPELLKSINVNPGKPIISCIEGFQLDLRGKVKAIPRSGKNIWGVTYRLKQEDLDRMYSGDSTREYRAEKNDCNYQITGKY